MNIDDYVETIAYGLDKAKKELSKEDYRDLLVHAQLYLMLLTKEVTPDFNDFIRRAEECCIEWGHERTI